jgi:hypothetical protein
MPGVPVLIANYGCWCGITRRSRTANFKFDLVVLDEAQRSESRITLAKQPRAIPRKRAWADWHPDRIAPKRWARCSVSRNVPAYARPAAIAGPLKEFVLRRQDTVMKDMPPRLIATRS